MQFAPVAQRKSTALLTPGSGVRISPGVPLNIVTDPSPGERKQEMDEIEEEELPEWATEVCEHGLSEWLCAGPNHYSDEF